MGILINNVSADFQALIISFGIKDAVKKQPEESNSVNDGSINK